MKQHYRRLTAVLLLAGLLLGMVRPAAGRHRTIPLPQASLYVVQRWKVPAPWRRMSGILSAG